MLHPIELPVTHTGNAYPVSSHRGRKLELLFHQLRPTDKRALHLLVTAYIRRVPTCGALDSDN